MARRAEHLRSGQTRRRLDGDRVARAQPPGVVAPDTRAGAWRRSNVSAIRPTPPPRTCGPCARRSSSSPCPTSPTRSSPSSCRASRTRRSAKATRCCVGDTQHDEQREERYALMLRRKEADGLIFSAIVCRRRPRPRPLDAARPRADRQRLRVQPAPRHAERAHRQREGGVRGHGPSLSARTSAHRHRHRAAGQSAQPRPSARRDRAREEGGAPSATSS